MVARETLRRTTNVHGIWNLPASVKRLLVNGFQQKDVLHHSASGRSYIRKKCMKYAIILVTTTEDSSWAARKPWNGHRGYGEGWPPRTLRWIMVSVLLGGFRAVKVVIKEWKARKATQRWRWSLFKRCLRRPEHDRTSRRVSHPLRWGGWILGLRGTAKWRSLGRKFGGGKGSCSNVRD